MSERKFSDLDTLHQDMSVIIYYLDRLKEAGIVEEGKYSITEVARPLVEEAIAEGHMVSDDNILKFCATNTEGEFEDIIAMYQILIECRDTGIDTVIGEYTKFMTNHNDSEYN